MLRAIDKFNRNIERVALLGGLHTSLISLTTPVVDVSDILRSQIVLAVSALDSFMHDVVRIGMLEVAQGRRSATEKYNNFKMRLQTINEFTSGTCFYQCLEREILQQHSYVSFQAPGKIAEALNYVCDISIWDKYGKHIGLDAKTAKAELSLIVDRRNKIAHEADYDPTFGSTRWPINKQDVDDAVEKIRKLCFFIFDVISIDSKRDSLFVFD